MCLCKKEADAENALSAKWGLNSCIVKTEIHCDHTFDHNVHTKYSKITLNTQI